MLQGNWVPPELRGKHRDPEKDAIENIYYLMRHMGWGLKETLNLPLPTYFELLQEIRKEAKKQPKGR